MKKILALLLVLVCAFALFACHPNDSVETPDDQNQQNTDTDKTNEPYEDPKADVTAFVNAIANTNPQQQTIRVAVDTSLGTLNGVYNVTYASDGSATIRYSYEQFNTIESGAEEEKSTVTGTIVRDKDGNYSGDLSGSVAEQLEFGFAINLKAVEEASTVEGNILTVKITKDQTASVFGKAFRSDVDLVLTLENDKIASFALSYEVDAGKVSVDCTYD